MTREDLAFVADALLALCEKDRRAPFYGEEAFKTKLKRSFEGDALFEHLLSRTGHDELLQHECIGVFRHAHLTRRQSDVLHLKLEGFTFEEIGHRAGHTKQGAQSIFSQALKKLVRSFHVYPYAGLSDVYRRETRRGLRPQARSSKMMRGECDA